MKKTRLLLIVAAAGLIALLYFLPKGVVENESQLQSSAPADDSTSHIASPHRPTPKAVRSTINRLRARYLSGPSDQKNAIFADSLIGPYQQAGLYDSAAWFAERANAFFKTDGSLLKAADAAYEAYTFAVEPKKQRELAEKTRALYDQVLASNPRNLDAKTKMAMTYMTSDAPMAGIRMLREVVEEDPRNELGLFNLGMLAIQSGQYGRASEWFEKLLAVNPDHLQGNLLLGVAWMNQGQKEKARQQFEKVKKMDADPAVQAAVDSYLQELK